MHGLFPDSKYCDKCHRGYKDVMTHARICKATCQGCLSPSVCADDGKCVCRACFRLFASESCLINHRVAGSSSANPRSKAKKSVCDLLKICRTCRSVYNTSKGRHSCATYHCTDCKGMHKKSAKRKPCYQQPIDPPAPKKTKKNGEEEYHPENLYVFYDFETRQNTHTPDGENEHSVILCVAQLCCNDCIAKELAEGARCDHCAVRELVYEGEKALKNFVELVVRSNSKFKQIICIAHNAKSFDTQFVLKHIVENSFNYIKNRRKPDIIMQGRKILCLKLGKTKFIDSINYMPMRLAALPACFGLGEDVRKGYFPHLFVTERNFGDIVTLPDPEYFAPEGMSVKGAAEFQKWYDAERAKNQPYNLKREMIEYCKQDVKILRLACLRFRENFLRHRVDPFAECITIASTCSRVNRKNFLKPDTIAIIPANGYTQSCGISKLGILYMLVQELIYGREIIHGGRAREVTLPCGFRVDGYLPPLNPEDIGDLLKYIIFELYGCYWHGHECRPDNRHKKLVDGTTLHQRYERTMARERQLREMGYTVVTRWECEFEDELKKKPEWQAYLADHPLAKRYELNPRDAFYGGRTGNTVALYECAEGEKIKMYDVCSMYPSICKTYKYPIGHPTIYVAQECTEFAGADFQHFDERVEGLVQCEILPPTNLFHPLLPMKANKKLLFALCRTCAETTCMSKCPHTTVEERALRGVWVSDELKAALARGYKLIKITVIWQFKYQYKLFYDFMCVLQKDKTEASGFPAKEDTEEKRYDWVDQYEKHEGVKLEYEKILYNPGKREVSKLTMNNVWGKYGQRGNLPKTVFVTTYEYLLRLLTDPELVVEDLLLVNEVAMFVTTTKLKEAEKSSSTSNCVISAYTTAHARMKLYEYLEKLDKRVLYYDTDSVFFVTRPGDEYEPETGEYFGDLTDELEKYGAGTYIDKFASGGPKFYAYQYVTPDGERGEVTKAKGIPLNISNSGKVNYKSIANLTVKANDLDCNKITLEMRRIRTTPLHRVVTVTERKTCSTVSRKRRFVDYHLSYPFGYVEEEEEEEEEDNSEDPSNDKRRKTTD